MAAELEPHGHQVSLVRGSGGIFLIKANGKVVWDNDVMGNFPQPGDIERRLKEV